MDSADQVMKLQVFQDQGPNPHKLLFEYLTNRHYAAFKSLAMKGLKKKPPNIDIDYVFPYPLDKTVLDIACANGLDEFVELILNLGANPNKENVAHQRSPLHFAAEAGNFGVLKILLNHPAIKPNLKVERQTALHLAVSNKNVECVEVLLEHNASPNIANSKGLTPTHMAAMTGQEEIVTLIFSKAVCTPDIDSFKDFTQRTTRQVLEQKLPDFMLPPVLERKTNLSDLKYFIGCNDEENFLANFEKVEVTSDEIRELLRIAARQNLAKVVKCLTETEIDENGSSLAEAADIAAVRGHHEVLKVLFDAGAERTGSLLMKACRKLASHAVRDSDRMACFRLILLKPVDVRCVDSRGNTALHYAASAQLSEITYKLLKEGSYIGHENEHGISPITNIAPETMSRYLDDCLQPSEEYLDHFEDYEIEFNYQCLAPLGITNNLNNKESLLEKGAFDYNSICMEMQPLLQIAKSKSHQHLLKHPILSSFLYLKWQLISSILYIKFIGYITFYLSTCIQIFYMAYIKEHGVNTRLNKSIDNHTNQSLTAGREPHNGLYWLKAIILVIYFFQAIFQLILSPRDLFSNSNYLSILQLICYFMVFVRDLETLASVLTIFLSLWELINQIGQHPRTSTEIEMFKIVIRNFIKYSLLYLCFIPSFALIFYLLFKDGNKTIFRSLGHSWFQTIIMSTGQFDTDGIPFVNYPILSYLVYVPFVFLMIVLFNLLISLAVNDINEIRHEAELVGLISRTKLVAYIESIFVGSPILKNRRCSHISGFIQRMKMNPLRFLSNDISFFPDFLPDAKIRVKPLRSNAVLSRGKAIARNSCSKLTMDRQIITHAKEIISRRGRVSDYQKILDTVNRRFDKIEALIRNFNQPEKENSNNNNYESE